MHFYRKTESIVAFTEWAMAGVGCPLPVTEYDARAQIDVKRFDPEPTVRAGGIGYGNLRRPVRADGPRVPETARWRPRTCSIYFFTYFLRFVSRVCVCVCVVSESSERIITVFSISAANVRAREYDRFFQNGFPGRLESVHRFVYVFARVELPVMAFERRFGLLFVYFLSYACVSSTRPSPDRSNVLRIKTVRDFHTQIPDSNATLLLSTP